MIYALAISLGVGAISSLTLALLWKSARNGILLERSAHEATKANLLATQAALQMSESGRTDSQRRFEAVIAGLEHEVTELEAAKSEDPEAQRARLARLSGG